MDGLNIVKIEDLPELSPLEQPLHKKKRRNWTVSQCTENVYQEARVNLKEEMEINEIGSRASPPLPAAFVECGSHSSKSLSPSRPVPSRNKHQDPLTCNSEIMDTLDNYGSEPESENNEDGDVIPIIQSRQYRDTTYVDIDDDNVVADTIPTETVVSANTDCHPNDNPITMPTGMYDFEWRKFPDTQIAPETRREMFSAEQGPTTPCIDPYSNFVAIWDLKIMKHIVRETNHYAQSTADTMIKNSTMKPDSRICAWYDVTVDELYMFFAILLAMGMIVKNRVVDYWSSDSDIFSTPGFRVYMPLKRFQILCKCLHFNNNRNMPESLDAGQAKLFKIEPLLSHLNKRFQALYKMGQNVALDESLLQWSGWLSINQFIPNKAAGVGIKSYEMCESQTGYLWRFEIHTHKIRQPPTSCSDPIAASTPSIVMKLIRGLEFKGHTIWMDNYYNSPALARRLKSVGIDCVGTLRTNRQFVPACINQLTKSNMKRGEITGLTSGDVDLVIWRDRNRVALISTYHGMAANTENGITKPNVIQDYNLMMGGVDKKDQMLAAYPMERKRTKIWYKKLFRRLLNVSVLNAFIISKKSNSVIDHRQFRQTLIKDLLEKHSGSVTYPERIERKTDIYSATVHHIAENPYLPSKQGRLRRQCVSCKKKCTSHCAGCKKSVCISPCFVDIHNLIN